MRTDTTLATAGRHPERFGGFVNTPVCRGSTILANSMSHWQSMNADAAGDVLGAAAYGRFGNPTTHAFEEAMASLEGGYRSLVYPSGLAAISTVLTALLAAGDHVLVPDHAYSPTRNFLLQVLERFGVDVSFYDPLAAEEIVHSMRKNTAVVYVESPGSDTFEIQDVPAIAKVAHSHGAAVVMDNTWGTPLFFKPFDHGVDVSIQAATKYIVGHSDAMLGVATCNKKTWARVRQTTRDMGQTAGPDDIYLALRGLRTMSVRLKQHAKSALRIAMWLEMQPQVEAVLYPALESHPGHVLWKRDFTGACGLFSIVLRTQSKRALSAFVDALEHFGLGLSWGGYESLVVPFTPTTTQLKRRWPHKGLALRLHIGLEDADDLIEDLRAGFLALDGAEQNVRRGADLRESLSARTA